MTYKKILISFLFMISLLMSIPCLALVDPTRPSDNDTVINTSNVLQLNAVMVGTDRRLAVINGKIVHEGDIFNNLHVVKIDNNSVVMEGPDGRFLLQLLTYPIKRFK